MSLNVNGIKGYEKRMKMVNHFLYPANKDKTPQVICLQETHISPGMEKDCLQSFNYDLCFGYPIGDRSGGLITGFDRRLNYGMNEHTYVRKFSSELLATHCTIEEKEYVIANVYIHPHETVQAVGEIIKLFKDSVDQFECSRIVWCGDFNVNLSELDKSIPKPMSHGSGKVNCVEDFIQEGELSDVYRTFFPDARRYSCFHRGAPSRVDYFFASLEVMNIITGVSIGISFSSDHAPIYLEFSIGRNIKGNNYWRFPTYLLQCNEYIDKIREHIPILQKRYTPDSNPQLIFDMVKVGIQQFTKSFVKDKNKRKKIQIENREAEIADLVQQIV